MYGLVPFSRRGNKLTRSAFDDMSDVLDNFFNTSLGTANNRMRSDIKEGEDNYLIDMELPGVKKEDIEVNLDNGYLTVSVEEKDEKEEQKENYIMKERRYGGCQRSFRVGNGVTKKDIKAKYDSGILTITIPKKDEVKRNTKININ